MSKVFSFELVSLNIPKMIETADKCFEKYESDHMVSENKLQIMNYKMCSGIFNGIMMKCFFGNDCINDTIADGKSYPEYICETMS